MQRDLPRKRKSPNHPPGNGSGPLGWRQPRKASGTRTLMSAPFSAPAGSGAMGGRDAGVGRRQREVPRHTAPPEGQHAGAHRGRLPLLRVPGGPHDHRMRWCCGWERHSLLDYTLTFWHFLAGVCISVFPISFLLCYRPRKRPFKRWCIFFCNCCFFDLQVAVFGSVVLGAPGLGGGGTASKPATFFPPATFLPAQFSGPLHFYPKPLFRWLKGHG